jgi:hypothetical protein
MPAGVFNVSVISKIKPISVLPMCCIFRDCYYSAANGTDNDTLGNFKVKALLLAYSVETSISLLARMRAAATTQTKAAKENSNTTNEAILK